MNTPTNNVQVQVDEKIREIELECMPDLKKEGTKIGGINFTLQGWEHLKNKIAEALTQTRHQATEDTIAMVLREVEGMKQEWNENYDGDMKLHIASHNKALSDLTLKLKEGR